MNADNERHPLIGIVMGSESDWGTMRNVARICDEFGVEYEKRVHSAHRTPVDMSQYGSTAIERGLKVIVAGASGAAHLPGMLASYTTLPVIGVPVVSRTLNGMDSLLSIVQMPDGIPVATVAIGGATNAGLLAISILSITDESLQKALTNFREKMAKKSRDQTKHLTSS